MIVLESYLWCNLWLCTWYNLIIPLSLNLFKGLLVLGYISTDVKEQSGLDPALNQDSLSFLRRHRSSEGNPWTLLGLDSGNSQQCSCLSRDPQNVSRLGQTSAIHCQRECLQELPFLWHGEHSNWPCLKWWLLSVWVPGFLKDSRDQRTLTAQFGIRNRLLLA